MKVSPEPGGNIIYLMKVSPETGGNIIYLMNVSLETDGNIMVNDISASFWTNLQQVNDILISFT
jgi:hypothetical protein